MKRSAVLITILALAAAGIASAATKARSTHGVAYVGITHQVGKKVVIAGDINDKLLGRGAIVYFITASSNGQPGQFTVKSKKITAFFPNGSLSGRGSGVQTVHPDGSADISNGRFNLTNGTGKLKGHALKGTFSGPQKNGIYKFSYKAKLK